MAVQFNNKRSGTLYILIRSVVCWGATLQPATQRVRCSVWLKFLPLSIGVHSASSKNDYRTRGAVRGRWAASSSSSASSVSRLCRQCKIFNASQHYKHERPFARITLFLSFRWCSYLTGNTLYGHPRAVRDIFTFLYEDDVRTLKETRLWASSDCYGDSFIFYM
jgi:hypothetical protein